MEVSVNRKSSNRSLVAKIVRSAGVVASSPKESIKVLADIVADKIEGNAESSLLAGIDYLNKKGDIKPEFLEHPQNRYFFIQIQEDMIRYRKDELKLQNKISLFLGIVSGEINADSIELRRIWKLVDQLTDQEIVLLAACYRLRKESIHINSASYDPDARLWINMMAKESGLRHASFTEEAEDQLIGDWLLEKRTANDQVRVTPEHRLTELGIIVSELLESGNKIIEASKL